ncbi:MULTISPECIES: hypothetical protein [Rhodococcus]|uniref:hypothetical protein n=1 Tax=Rhodococcus TaxID=1827 RepID=UPI00138AC4AA|nr:MULTISPECIES: hypothetical protein [Rhodococcus]
MRRTSLGAEHHQIPTKEHSDVVKHGARDGNIVGHDQDGGVDLRIDIDQQLAEVGPADRVETGVRRIAQNELRVENQSASETGTLSHSAGDLARELVSVADSHSVAFEQVQIPAEYHQDGWCRHRE